MDFVWRWICLAVALHPVCTREDVSVESLSCSRDWDLDHLFRAADHARRRPPVLGGARCRARAADEIKNESAQVGPLRRVAYRVHCTVSVETREIHTKADVPSGDSAN